MRSTNNSIVTIMLFNKMIQGTFNELNKVIDIDTSLFPGLYSPDKCSEDSFECEEGGCISASFFCDFVEHCLHGSDEKNCGKVFPIICFQCTVQRNELQTFDIINLEHYHALK